MKKVSVLFSCLFILLTLTGCGPQNQRKSQSSRLENKTRENVFPEFLLGVWEADKFRWRFKFERDGTISELLHTMGMSIRPEEGGFFEEGLEESNAAYVMGPCEASYDPNARELNVKIVLDYFRIEIPFGVFEGGSKDYFSGVISKDGKRWDVEWLNYGQLEGSEPPDPNVIKANPEKLVFTKIDIK